MCSNANSYPPVISKYSVSPNERKSEGEKNLEKKKKKQLRKVYYE